MKNQKGFTMIELIIVIVILGILAAVAVPKFVDLSGASLDTAQRGMVGAVRSAHTILIAQNAATTPAADPHPTLTALAGAITGTTSTVAADGSGVEVEIDGTNYIVLTYTDADCTALNATTAGGDTVRCVGDI